MRFIYENKDHNAMITDPRKNNHIMETQQHQTVIETLRDLQALSLKIGTLFFIIKGSLAT